MAISNNLVILICIVGAAAVVLVGFAFHRGTKSLAIFKGRSSDNGFNERNVDQDRYMAELRDRHRMHMFSEMKPHKFGPPRDDYA